jgi:ATP/maltotriose-dependent transcriptional regulator MalT
LTSKRLAVIKAPAARLPWLLLGQRNFGKADIRLAWQTIDSDDDQPPRFLFYVSQARRLSNESRVLPATMSEIQSLSARESDILKLIAQGLSNKEIARLLAIDPETVKSHCKHIFTKLGAEKRAQAVSRAQSLGLVSTR